MNDDKDRRISDLENRLNIALDLLELLIEDDDCSYDSYGHCQAHDMFWKDPPCPHEVAKKLLKECGRNIDF